MCLREGMREEEELNEIDYVDAARTSSGFIARNTLWFYESGE